MVTTFEVVGGRIEKGLVAPTMAAASALLPEGAYTTLRTYGGTRVVRLREHVRRLTSSIDRTASAPLEEAAVRNAIAEVLRATGHAETRLRLTFAPPRLFMSAENFVPLPPSFYELGVSCSTVPLRRQNPKAKDTRFASEAERAYQALPPGVHEGLLVSGNAILEGLSSNFFACHEGTLRTEEERALDGVTRCMVLEVAASVVPIVRDAIRLDELPRVSEGFLTSVSRGILPVIAIDGERIGSGQPGSLAARLSKLFDELVEREAEDVGRAAGP